MNITLFFCEHAATRSDGKLTADGIFNELYTPSFPAKQDKILLAGIIEWDRDIKGRQPFTIHLLDPEEKPIFTIEGHSEIDERSDERPPAKTHLIFPLENLIFTDPGQYQVRIDLLGQQISGPSLHLMQSDKE
jgi:hypothetical protein